MVNVLSFNSVYKLFEYNFVKKKNMNSSLLLVALVITIAIAVAFIVVYMRKNFYVSKETSVASNTARGAALLADFILLNVINIVYRLSRLVLDPVYRLKFQDFAEQIFHGGGNGLSNWFWNTQAMLLGIFFVYSLVSELFLKSTPAGYFFGLKIEEASPAKLLLRNLLKPISLLFWPIFAMLSNLNTKRRWLHDIVSKTYVTQSR